MTATGSAPLRPAFEVSFPVVSPEPAWAEVYRAALHDARKQERFLAFLLALVLHDIAR